MSGQALVTKGKAWNEFAHKEGKAGEDFALLLLLWQTRQMLIDRGILKDRGDAGLHLTQEGEDVLNRLDGYVMYRTAQP